MFTFGSAFVLFVSACIGMLKNVGRVAGFTWNAGVTVENLLPADPVFHSPPAPVQYTCFNGQEIFFISASLASKVAFLSW